MWGVTPVLLRWLSPFQNVCTTCRTGGGGAMSAYAKPRLAMHDGTSTYLLVLQYGLLWYSHAFERDFECTWGGIV
jgi:hypothetical protein